MIKKYISTQEYYGMLPGIVLEWKEGEGEGYIPSDYYLVVEESKEQKTTGSCLGCKFMVADVRDKSFGMRLLPYEG